MDRYWDAARLDDRAVDELIGICRGVLADGAVNETEAQYVLQWMRANREVASRFPADRLFTRLKAMLVDRKLDLEEQAELLDTLAQFVGGPPDPSEQGASTPTSLPLCVPAPTIVFEGRQFCLTGKFASGSRKECEAAVVARGGTAHSTPSKGTSYLVIGSVGSAAWIHSTHGRKIEEAVELRARGLPIHIVSEEHWVAALAPPPN